MMAVKVYVRVAILRLGRGKRSNIRGGKTPVRAPDLGVDGNRNWRA